MREYMLESMKYWVNEYHIDGFRVDLMGVHDIETMNDIRRELNAIDPEIFVYGEGWSAGTCAYPHDKLAVKAAIHRCLVLRPSLMISVMPCVDRSLTTTSPVSLVVSQAWKRA